MNLVCTRCGNETDFSCSLQHEVNIDADGKVTIGASTFDRDARLTTLCKRCSRTSVVDLDVVTPIEFLKDIGRNHCSGISCQVSFINKAKEWVEENCHRALKVLNQEVVGEYLAGINQIPKAAPDIIDFFVER